MADNRKPATAREAHEQPRLDLNRIVALRRRRIGGVSPQESSDCRLPGTRLQRRDYRTFRRHAIRENPAANRNSCRPFGHNKRR